MQQPLGKRLQVSATLIHYVQHIIERIVSPALSVCSPSETVITLGEEYSDPTLRGIKVGSCAR